MSMYSISGQRIARLARAGEVSSTRTAASRSLPRRPRRPAPTGKRQPLSIAVLGGGLTGLTTAWYLAQHLPKTRITVYEATNRLGGWIDTVKVAVKTPDGQNGTVSFERGARMVHIPRPGTLKWDDMVLYEMIYDLGLTDKVRSISRAVPVKNYIYYPDHLVEMPTPKPPTGLHDLQKLWTTLFKEPIFKRLPAALWHGWKTAPATFESVSRDHDWVLVKLDYSHPDNMSLDDYYTKVTGQPSVADNLLSAMIHGIWGGDVSRISSRRDPFGHIHDRPALGRRWDSDRALVPSEDAALFWESSWRLGAQTQKQWNFRWTNWTTHASNASHISFEGGFSTLTTALEEQLERNPMVTLLKNEPVGSVRMHATNTIAITSKGAARPMLYEKVISTINSQTLASITGNKLPSLADSHAVTIRVVNLWYPTPGLNEPHRGFGYLIPKTVSHELNPECALGVLFDSDREVLTQDSPDTVPGTKLTVLLGGHYWDDLPAELIPDSDQAIEMAKAVVARHLGIPKHENDRAVASTKLCRECIPQHYVGHWGRMARARGEIKSAFGDSLAVAGPSYQMPGVLGSIRAARDIAFVLARPDVVEQKENDPNLAYLSLVGSTGLDRFFHPSTWIAGRKANIPMRFPREQSGLRKKSIMAGAYRFFKYDVSPLLRAFLRWRKARRGDK